MGGRAAAQTHDDPEKIGGTVPIIAGGHVSTCRRPCHRCRAPQTPTAGWASERPDGSAGCLSANLLFARQARLVLRRLDVGRGGWVGVETSTDGKSERGRASHPHACSNFAGSACSAGCRSARSERQASDRVDRSESQTVGRRSAGQVRAGRNHVCHRLPVGVVCVRTPYLPKQDEHMFALPPSRVAATRLLSPCRGYRREDGLSLSNAHGRAVRRLSTTPSYVCRLTLRKACP
jgi:hypothetical protein